ncbi:hypothetical protein ACFSRY_14000 [Pontibacter locisalis]|uniref:Lipocalin-like domain-containing protein n=1 Tax=Pontibacter locisalis TaxID=1719035 RepID=A0ABW5IPD6_9BACT
MKNRSILYLLIALFSFTFSGCISDAEEDFMLIAEKIKNGDKDSGSSGSCPVGKWGTATCNGSKSLIYYFGSNGEGYSENPDCNGICTPLKFHFKYTVNGNKITYNFTKTDDVICSGANQGRPSVPSGTYTITYTCSNNGSELITQTSTNGVIRTTTFTRR